MLRDFADRVVAATQSSHEMVVPVMLAGMSAAVQGVVDVKHLMVKLCQLAFFFCDCKVWR
jgi:hypothetical protein